VRVKTLVDKEATGKALLGEGGAIGWLEKSMQRGDVAMVFFAGGGERHKKGQYYLAPHGVTNAEDLPDKGIETQELLKRLRQMPGQTVLVLDCYPLPKRRDGRTAAGDSSSRAPVPEDVVQAAVDDIRGVSVLRSSMGVNLAPDQDGSARPGFITALTEGLSGKADLDGNKEIDLDELGQYVRKRVAEQTSGRQQPKLDRPLNAPLLRLARIADPKPPAEPRDQRTQGGTDEGAPPAADRAVIVIDVPAGGRAFIDGADCGSQKRFTYGPLRPGAMQKHEVRIVSAAGEEVVRSVHLRGGWLVHLYAVAPAADRPELVVQLGHAQDIHAVALSRDGKMMLTGGEDHVALLWEIDSGKQLRAFRGHTNAVLAVAFSPDGKYVLTGSKDRTAILWETATGKKLQTYRHRDGAVFAVAFSPDGKQVLTGSADHTAVRWQADTAQMLTTYAKHEDTVHAVVFSPDGKQVLTGSADGKAILWQTDGRLLHPFASHQGAVWAVAFSPDGKRALTGSADTTAIVWDVETKKSLQTLKGRHDEAILAVAFSRDGRQVLTGSRDRTAIIWETDSGQKAATLQGHHGSVTGVAFHPDGQPLTASRDQTVILWEVNTEPSKPAHVFHGSVRRVTALALDRDSGRHLLVGSEDSAALAWDLTSGAPQRSCAGPSSRAHAVALSSSGSEVLVGFEDGAALLWRPGQSGPLRLLDKAGQVSAVLAVALSPDGKRAAIGCASGEVRLHATDSGDCLRTLKGHTGPVNALAFSADGKQLVSGSDDWTAILWDVDTGKSLPPFEGRQGEVRAVALRADGKQLLTGLADGTVILWDVQTRNIVRRLKDQPGRVNAVAFSSDGRQLLTTSGAMATLWDAASDNPLRTFTGHEGEIRAAVLGPDDRLVITGGEDGTVRLWDIASGDELARLLGLDGGKEWLVLAADGLFDGSPPGREKVLLRVSGADMPVAVERFFQALYRPGLLALAARYQRPAAPTQVVGKKPPPTLKLLVDPPYSEQTGKRVAPRPKVTVTIEATDKGGGIAGLTLRLNGAVVFNEAGAGKEASLTITRPVEVTLLDGENTLLATGASAEGWDSEPVELKLHFGNPAPRVPTSVKSRINLYLLAVGVSEYKEPGLRLKFAAADARSLFEVFESWAVPGGLYGEKYTCCLTDAEATRDKILGVMDEMARKAEAKDVFVLFLAGHGAQHEERYFFLPYEMTATGSGVVTPSDLEKQALNIDSLEEHLAKLKTGKRLLIYDTCHAGAAQRRFSAGAVPPEAALRKAIERLNRARGTISIASAGAKEEAQENEKLEHGLFTYAVLEALRKVEVKSGGEPPLAKQRDVSVFQLCHYACDQSPELYQRYRMKLQQPVMNVSPGSNDFPLLWRP
jgi:WD40 repeat protein/uncharacterized caspase-like protein